MSQKPLNEKELGRFIIHTAREVEGQSILLKMEIMKLQEEYTLDKHYEIMHRLQIIDLQQYELNGKLDLLNKLTETFISKNDDLSNFE